VVDLVLTIFPAGSELWGGKLHEPIVIALIPPLLNYRPWQVRESGGLAELLFELPSVWSADWAAEGDSLRKFWNHEVPDDPGLLWGLAR
jgi:hypothetical protein